MKETVATLVNSRLFSLGRYLWLDKKCLETCEPDKPGSRSFWFIHKLRCV